MEPLTPHPPVGREETLANIVWQCLENTYEVTLYEYGKSVKAKLICVVSLRNKLPNIPSAIT